MYIPAHFAAGEAAVRELLARHGAADLITLTGDGLLATMLPFAYEPAAGEQVPDVSGVRARPLLVLAGRDRDPGDRLGVGGVRVPDPDAGHGPLSHLAWRPVAWPRPWPFDRTAPPG